MATLMKDLGIDKLSVEQRMQLVGEIWESFEPEPPLPPLTAAQKAELERRIADSEANPDEGSSWEEIKARLMARK